jgi:hypothetical protein
MSDPTSTKYTSLTQVFRVAAPTGIPGVFVSKIGLYFKAKSDSLGAQVFLVRLTNGLPDQDKILPNSLVTVNPEDVNVSADGTAETVFTFPQLQYLESAQSYGFCVRPIGNSPDYLLWVGELGGRDIGDDKPIGSNPLVEQAYYAGNQQRYADMINQDIKFKLYRAKFSSTYGTAAIRNKNTDVFSISSLSTLTGVVGIRAGDQLFGWSNGFVNTAISGTVSKLDLTNSLVYIKNSTGNFTANSDVAFVRTGNEEDTALSNTAGILGLAKLAAASSNGLYKFNYHAIVPKLGIVKTPLTDITLTYKGAIYNGAAYTQDTKTFRVDNDIEYEFQDATRVWLGESEEVNAVNQFRTGVTPSGLQCTNSSIIIEATLSSNNNFISPVIDLRKNNVVLLRNLINANTTNEHTRTGAAASKYVSKIVTLEDQMEAEDLKIYITANKPANTDIKVYTKVWNAADPESFDSKVWSLMALENIEGSRNTNSPDEYIEYVYSFANSASAAGNALAAYQANNSVPVVYYAANSTGGVTGGPFYGGDGYDRVIKKFAVKLVLTADSGKEYVYPKVNDLRVIALQI